jgi:hypothetical protein
MLMFRLQKAYEFYSLKFVLTNQQFMYCWSFKANRDKVSWLNNVYCDCARKCILKPTLLFIASILNINLFLLPFKHVFSISKEQAFFKQPLGTVFLLFLSYCVPLFCNISFLTEVRLFMSMLKPKKSIWLFCKSNAQLQQLNTRIMNFMSPAKVLLNTK